MSCSIIKMWSLLKQVGKVMPIAFYIPRNLEYNPPSPACMEADLYRAELSNLIPPS